MGADALSVFVYRQGLAALAKCEPRPQGEALPELQLIIAHHCSPQPAQVAHQGMARIIIKAIGLASCHELLPGVLLSRESYAQVVVAGESVAAVKPIGTARVLGLRIRLLLCWR